MTDLGYIGGQSLNDRANAAAGRAAAKRDAERARKRAADKQYWRAYGSQMKQRADDAAVMERFRNNLAPNPITGKPPTAGPRAPRPTRSSGPDVTAVTGARSRSQWSTGDREAVYSQYAELLMKYGFSRADIHSWLKGLSYQQLQNPSLVTQAFRETPMWQERFGWVTSARAKNGMSYINEGQIIALEDTYRQIFTAAGIPEAYWERSDLQKLIAEDVSPQEVQDRVSLAEDAVNNTDKNYVRAFRQYYGVGKKDLIGYMLDRKKGVQLLQEQVAAAEIGSEARATGMDHVGRKFSEQLVDKDISREEARQAFATVADQEKDWKMLAALSGETITERGLIKDELGLDKNGNVGRKKRRLASQERARFGGSSAGTVSLGNSTSGAY